MGAGEWAERGELGREVRDGCLVCGEPGVLAGFEDSLDDGFEGDQEGGDQPGRGGYYGGVYGERSGAMNVLISSVGRRVGLIGCLRDSMKRLGMRGHVYGVDISSTAPGFHLCDEAWVVPPCKRAEFIDEVLDLCRLRNITVVIPTIDTELQAYAEEKGRFVRAGVLISVSTPGVIQIASDKGEANAWMKSRGIPSVRQLDGEEIRKGSGDWRFPLIAKPRAGSASAGIRRIASPEELELVLRDANGDMVFEELANGQEYTVNAYVNGEGRCVCAVPHRRLEVRAGEVSKGVTAKIPDLIEYGRMISEALPGAFGAMNMQCFVDAEGGIRFFEINARFGGGYPLAHHAGARFTDWLLSEARGERTPERFEGWQDRLAMLRYDQALYLPEAVLVARQHEAKIGSV